MENQIEIVKDIAESMIGIGGIPNNNALNFKLITKL